MTPLRQQMIDAMRQRGFSVRTHRSYLTAVRDLAAYHRQSPDELSVEALQVFLNHLVQKRQLSAATCRVYLNGLRFLYLQVLKWPAFDVQLVVPKRPQRIPELLTRSEVCQILGACKNPKHRMMLQVTYSCGLRVSELVALKVRDIDGERGLLRIEQGKGAKDRMVILAPGILNALRQYWSHWHPRHWLFPHPHQPLIHLNASAPQRAFKQAKMRSGVQKTGGIHSLRHAYATHQLEHGLPVHELQRLLGHSDLRSTLHYVHWVPGYQRCGQGHADLIGEGT